MSASIETMREIKQLQDIRERLLHRLNQLGPQKPGGMFAPGDIQESGYLGEDRDRMEGDIREIDKRIWRLELAL